MIASDRAARSRAERRRTTALRVVTVAGLLLVAVTAAAWATGVKPLVFTSGSMAPSITTGSLALAQSADPSSLEAGDVVSVVGPAGDRVTHRVVAVSASGPETALVLRGDANTTNDPEPYVVSSADRVLVSVPTVGRVVAYLDGKGGLVLLAVAGIGIAASVRRPGGTGHRRATASSGPPLAVFSVSSLLVCGALVAGSVPTAAYWTDTALARSGNVTAAGPSPAPTNGACADAGNSNIAASWTSVGQRYRYQLTLHRLDGAQVGGVVYVPAVSAATATSQVTPATFSPSAVSSTGQFNFAIRVRSLPIATMSWLSAGFSAVPVHFEGANYGALRCGNDTATTVSIDSLGPNLDTGQSATDFVTNVKANAIRGSGEPGATVVLTRTRGGGTTTYPSVTVNAAGMWTVPVPLDEGNQSFTAAAADLAGNTANTSASPRVVQLDTVAPVIQVTSPALPNYQGVAALRDAVLASCGNSNRVGCGTITDVGGSGVSPTTVPSWQLRRDYRALIGIFSFRRYLNETGTYQDGAVSSSATFVNGSFTINVPTQSGDFYPNAGFLQSGSAYTLTVSGATDVAGNVAASFARTFSD